MSPLDRVEVLQAWLALEHEAVWLYGVIGGRIEDVSGAAHRAWNRHRNTRDRLIALIHSLGANPAAPAMGYEPTHLDSEDQARAAAQSVENRVAGACVRALASAPDRHRAAAGLQTAATAAVQWGGKPEAFPGLDQA
jgi:hypothetical protein